MADVDVFFKSINTNSHAKLLEWMEAEAQRQRGFMAEPTRIERPRALVSVLDLTWAA